MIAFTPTGRFFLTAHRYAGQHRYLKLWEIASAQPVFACKPSRDGRGYAPFFALSRNGQKIFALDAPVQLWDLSTGQVDRDLTFDPKGPFSSIPYMFFSPAGSQVLWMGDNNTIKLLNLGKEEKCRTLAGPYANTMPTFAFAFLPAGKAVRPAPNLQIFSFMDSKPAPKRSVPLLFVVSTSPTVLSTDGRWFLTAGGLWDVEKGTKVWDSPYRLAQNPIPPVSTRVALSTDATFALAGGHKIDRPLQLWDLQNHKVAADLAGHTGDIRSLIFSHDGKLALSNADDQIIKLWEVPSGKLLHSLPDPGGPFSEVAFSSDDKLMLSRGTLQTAWEVATGKLVQSIERPAKEVRHFAYSADGSLGLSGIFDNVLTLWDMKTRKVVRMLEQPKGVASPVCSITFSPDGKLVVVGAAGAFGTLGDAHHKLHVWDVEAGEHIITSPKYGF